MYTLVILSLIAVILVALGHRREKLEATPNIKAPPAGGAYDAAERDRIYEMLIPTTRTSLEEWVAANTTTGSSTESLTDRAKAKAAEYVARFYTAVYATAAEPITVTNINTWANANFQEENTSLAQTAKEISNIRDVLTAYFIAQQGTTTTAGTTGTTTTAGTTDTTTTAGTTDTTTTAGTTGTTTTAGTTDTTTTGGTTGTTTTGGTTGTTTTAGTTGTTATAGTTPPPAGNSDSGSNHSPAPRRYADIRAAFELKKGEYDILMNSTNPTEADMQRLRTLNREMFGLLEEMVRVLAVTQPAELEAVSRDLSATLSRIEKQYTALSTGSDRVETLRRIREFEEIRNTGNLNIYMTLLLVSAMAVFIAMVFAS